MELVLRMMTLFKDLLRTIFPADGVFFTFLEPIRITQGAEKPPLRYALPPYGGAARYSGCGFSDRLLLVLGFAGWVQHRDQHPARSG